MLFQRAVRNQTSKTVTNTLVNGITLVSQQRFFPSIRSASSPSSFSTSTSAAAAAASSTSDATNNNNKNVEVLEDIVIENVEETSYASSASSPSSHQYQHDENNTNNSENDTSQQYSSSSSSSVQQHHHGGETTTSSSESGKLPPFSSSSAFVECSSFDPYARAKISNFVKRQLKVMKSSSSSVGFPSSSSFKQTNFGSVIFDSQDATSCFITVPFNPPQQQQEQLEKEEELEENKQTYKNINETAASLFRSRVILPLPSEYGIRIGEGEASNAKDAETLAAMHASNILDELGFQLYTLSSMQKKHATQVRAAGRFAPMPNEKPRSPATPSPPPLRRQQLTVDETENGVWQIVDLAATKNMTFLSPNHTMLSPFILDPGALTRVRSLWQNALGARELNFSIRNVSSSSSSSQQQQGNNNNNSEKNNCVIAEVWLAESFGSHVAQGKGPDKNTAMILAAMHLELIFDAAKLPLYPNSKEKQNQHADAAFAFGRSAPYFGDKPSQPGTFRVPKPLKGIFRRKLKTLSSSSSSNENNNISTTSEQHQSSSSSQTNNNNNFGELWIARHVTLLSSPDSSFQEVASLDKDLDSNNNHIIDNQTSTTSSITVKYDPEQELSDFLHSTADDDGSCNEINNTSATVTRDPFLSIIMPQDGRVRTSVVLPSVQGMDKDQIYGGVAEAANRLDSRALAAQHALDVLNTLGVLVHASDSDLQASHEKRRLDRGKVVASEVHSVLPLPPPLRLIGLNFHSQNQNKNINNSNNTNNNNTTTVDATTFTSSSSTTKSNNNNNNDMNGIPEEFFDDIPHPHNNNINKTSSPQSSTTGSQNNNTSSFLFDPNEEFIKKTQAPTHYWDLRSDSQDGFILVDSKPVAASGTTSHSISSIRCLDPSARDRIGSYAVFHDKTALDFVKTYCALTKENTPYYSTHITVPGIPNRFGPRIAVGEALTQKHSEILASMHCEMILDRLGLLLFPGDKNLQERHAKTARSLGRFAPLPTPTISSSENKNNNINEQQQHPGTTPSPPPLRTQSLQPLVEVPLAPISGSGAEYLQLPTELFNSPEVLDLNSVMRVQFYLKRHRRTVVVPDVYSLPDPACTNNNLHIAVIHVPLPSQYGRRTAVGIALTRKEAETLCFMHAEQIIDAMGVPLFPIDSLQQRHSQRVEKLGRRAISFVFSSSSSSSNIIDKNKQNPFVVDPSTVVTPPALRLDPNAVAKPKQIPQVETFENMFLCDENLETSERIRAWQDYVHSCDVYSNQVKKYDRAAKLAADHVPRTGDSLIDEALQECESKEVHRDVRNHLMTYCLKMNVEYPQNWNTVQIGTTTIRKSFTRVSVPGFPQIEALGIANNKEQSMRKAAHHALSLLKRMDPDFGLFDNEVLSGLVSSSGGSESGGQQQQQQQQQGGGGGGGSGRGGKARGPDHGSYDRISGSFTTDGKIRLVNLYTLCNGLAAPVVSHREKIEDGRRVQYTTIEVADLSGSRIVGCAQEAGRRTNEPAAHDDLVNTLLKRVPQFGSLARLLKTHPHLDPEHIVHLEMPKELEGELSTLLQEETESAVAENASLEQQEEEYEEEEAASAEKTTDEILSTVDVATNLLLQRSREVTELDPLAAKRLQAFLKSKLQMRFISKEYKTKFKSRRESLSIWDKRQEILETIQNNPVMILCGTTGCGKSTQIGQYILDDGIEKGKGPETTIVCTQPRRISAMSIAQRVAAERLEKIGESVGYTVRLDSKPGSNINYCTSGVLLRLLQSTPTIDHIKYLIVDEIHERDINSDFLLILIKKLIHQRKDLRVILMSATLQSDLFSGFFGGAPVVNVEGHVYPAQELFLDEIAQTVKDRGLVTPTTKIFLEGKEEVATVENAALTSSFGDDSYPNQNEQQQQQQDQQQNQFYSTPPSSSSQNNKKGYGTLEAPTEIDYPLIAFTIEHASKDFDLHQGSILVFLPGWEEITRIRDMFIGNPTYHVLPLHSSVSPEDQLKCFDPPPQKGQVKLILSTNIAESGVTIDDIGCVIDCGRAKEKTYLTRRGRTSVGRKEMGTMSQLVQVLASKANVVQRRGRVGRTRPGVCMRLFSRRQFGELCEFATPEILRQPLDALCLQIIALKLGDPIEFLSQALEPPPAATIEAAMLRLFHLGAITEHRQLSPLGLRLALLPVAPKVGKMILYGAALQCLDSALTLAACADLDPFVSQREMKELVKISKLEFSNNTLSDPILNVNAYNSWVNAKINLSSEKVGELEQQRTLSKLSLVNIGKYKEQYYDILRQSGFLETPDQQEQEQESASASAETAENTETQQQHHGEEEQNETPSKQKEQQQKEQQEEETSTTSPTTATTTATTKSYFSNGEIFIEHSPFSTHSNSLALLKALLCSGLFPNVSLFRDKRRFRSKLQNMVHPFPASVVSKVEEDDISSPFFVFDEMVKTAGDPRVFFRGVTNCSVWAIILLGASGSHGHMEFRHDLNLAILDDWLVFRVTAETLELIQTMRHKFLTCIERKFLNPTDQENNTNLSKLQRIIQELVSAPVRPNDLTTSLWAERGELVEVDVKTLLSEVYRRHGGGREQQEEEEKTEEEKREEVATATIEAAQELKESKMEREEEQQRLRVGLADDEEDN